MILSVQVSKGMSPYPTVDIVCTVQYKLVMKEDPVDIEMNTIPNTMLKITTAKTMSNLVSNITAKLTLILLLNIKSTSV